MADSFIQVAPDSTGKLMQTYLNTISGNPVHAEAVSLVDSSGNPITTLNVNVGSSINANFTGTVNVAQSNASLLNATVSQGGTWNIGTLASVTNPVMVQQTNASNFLATVSGSVTATGPITNAQLRASEVSVSAASLPLPALASTSTKQSDGTQKTQICDPTNVSNVAGITSGALNVFLASITANAGTSLNTTNVSVKMLTGAPNLFNAQVAATNVAATLVAARTLRRLVTIRNLDASNSGYIGLASIASTNGMLIQPKESISLDFTGLIQVITLTGTTANFAYLETFD